VEKIWNERVAFIGFNLLEAARACRPQFRPLPEVHSSFRRASNRGILELLAMRCEHLRKPGAAISSGGTERISSLMVWPRAEARASSCAHSASLTLVPSDLVRSGGFTTQHRLMGKNLWQETATATATAWNP
jgi:hypothetical protein